MTCTVHRIRGPIQSGKTTMALGILERLERTGVDVLYITPLERWAHEMKLLKVTTVPCMAWSAAVRNPPPSARAVVVDGVDLLPVSGRDAGLLALRQKLDLHVGPTQLILVETSETPNVRRKGPAEGRSP